MLKNRVYAHLAPSMLKSRISKQTDRLILERPIIEIFKIYENYFPRDIVPCWRIGPDRLHPATFNGSPWLISRISYWYRSHVWCHEADCDCVHSYRLGDGLCIVEYSDGHFGYYPLAPSYTDGDAINWAVVAKRNERLLRDELMQMRGLPPSQAELANVPPCADALAGVWAALDASLRSDIVAVPSSVDTR